MFIIVLEGGTNCFEGGAECVAVIVLRRRLHVHHYCEDKLSRRGLEPECLQLDVLCFKHLDVGADSFAKSELPLQDIDKRVKDTGRGWLIRGRDHLCDDFLEVPFVHLFRVAVRLS